MIERMRAKGIDSQSREAAGRHLSGPDRWSDHPGASESASDAAERLAKVQALEGGDTGSALINAFDAEKIDVSVVELLGIARVYTVAAIVGHVGEDDQSRSDFELVLRQREHDVLRVAVLELVIDMKPIVKWLPFKWRPGTESNQRHADFQLAALRFEPPENVAPFTACEVAIMVVQCGDRLPNDATLTIISKGPEVEPTSGGAFHAALANQYVWTGILDLQSVRHVNGLQLDVLGPPAVNEPTLGEVVRLYFTEHAELSEKTKECYRKCIVHGFRQLVSRPITCLIRKEILQLNLARLRQLTAADPVNKPPRGFWGWQQELRTLRVLRWYAAHIGRDDPWPDKRALRLSTPTARELPLELQTIEGRRKLIDGLASMRTRSARACRFMHIPVYVVAKLLRSAEKT